LRELNLIISLITAIIIFNK